MDALPGKDTTADLARKAGLAPVSIVLSGPLEAPANSETTLDPNRDIYPASMIKTPLVAAALADVADGRLKLSDRFEVSSANMTFNDAPSPLHTGAWARLDEICELAISRSDNVATNMLFDAVGRERATRIVNERFGLRATAFHRKLSGSDPLIDDPQWDGVHHNAHPALDAAALFTLIALDRIPHADLVRGALVRQYWNDKLSKGLRAGDRFAHKTGDTNDVTHDGGILTTGDGRTFVIVVYTAMSSTSENNARFAPFMETLRALL
ncbi:MAG TPA: serine hydrolase [Candidatus Baltobacteraceae bacterium]|jgi:beta-lactamase class A|nr:serine hydrolase [Candidatus Baltobacteraceae bacterium]